jgi:hypothetical protein
VATFLVVYDETDSSEGFYNLAAGKRFTQRLTSICFIIDFGADFI